MKAYIYIEGGGEDSDLDIRCREGFRKLLLTCGFKGRMPRLVACGGRDAVHKDFSVALDNQGPKDYMAMWIDSEEPMLDIESAWSHLQTIKTVSRWRKPATAQDHQVLFMTTCMETWIIADRSALAAHYGSKLQQSALPPLENLEERSRHDIQDQLVHATRNCTNAYLKDERSFEILGKLTPDALKCLPSFLRVLRILTKHL